jgi:hypothetical protein
MPYETDAQAFAKGLVALLKEYAATLQRLWQDIRDARENARSRKVPPLATPEWIALGQRMSNLQGPLFNMTRQASQLAEQGAVYDLTKLELRVRLADVEGHIHAINHLLNSPGG